MKITNSEIKKCLDSTSSHDNFKTCLTKFVDEGDVDKSIKANKFTFCVDMYSKKRNSLHAVGELDNAMEFSLVCQFKSCMGIGSQSSMPCNGNCRLLNNIYGTFCGVQINDSTLGNTTFGCDERCCC